MVISYIVSITLCLITILTLTQLPSIGIGSKESVFSLLWALLAALVLIAHVKFSFKFMSQNKSRKTINNRYRLDSETTNLKKHPEFWEYRAK